MDFGKTRDRSDALHQPSQQHQKSAHDPGKSPHQTGQPGENPKLPETTFGLLKLVFTSAFKHLPKMIASMAIKGILSFTLAFVINFYVIAVKNNGLGMSLPKESPWYPLLNIGENQAAFSALCFLAFFILTSLFDRIRDRGLKRFLLDLVGIPSWTAQAVRETGRLSVPVLAIAAGMSLFLSLVVENRYLFISLAFGILMGYSARHADFSLIFAQTIWSDTRKLFGRQKQKKEAPVGAMALFMLGLAIGLVLLVFIPKQPVLPVLAGIVLIALGILAAKRKVAPRAAIFIFGLVITSSILSGISSSVYADDGGWWEGGADWWTWIRSPGAWAVIRNGFRTGLLATAGSIIGSLFNAGCRVISSAVTGAYNVASRGASAVYDTLKNASDRVAEGVSQASDAVAEGLRTVSSGLGYTYDVVTGTIAGTVGQVIDTAGYVLDRGWEEIKETASGFKDGVFQLLADPELWDSWFDNMYADVTQMESSLGDFAGSVWETASGYADWQIVKDGLGGTLDDIGYGLSTSAGWIRDEAVSYWNTPDAFWDRAYENVTTGVETAGNVLANTWNAVSNTVNDPEKVYQTVKDMIGADNFSNSWDPNRSGWDRIGQSLWGTFELGGTLSTIKEAGMGLTRYADDLVGQAADDAARELAELNARGLADDGARALGDKGLFIHVQNVDPNFIPGNTKRTLSDLARELNVQIQVRIGNADSVKWFDEGLGVPKPLDLKFKTINKWDEMLGCPTGSRGVVGCYNPSLPANFKSLPISDQTKLLARFDDRVKEMARYSSDMNRMMQEGRYSIVNNMVYDVKAQKFVAGDVDLYHITQADGTPLPDSMIRQIENRLMGNPDTTVLHRSCSQQGLSADVFDPHLQDKYIRGGTTTGEGVISINADGSITQAYSRHDFYQRPAPRNPWAEAYGTTQTVKTGLSADAVQQ